MDFGSILLILALFILVAIFLARPLLEKRAPLTEESDLEVSALLAERERVLNSLLDLDFDHGLGKMPDEAYSIQRSVLLKHGAEVLRKLEEVSPGVQVRDVLQPGDVDDDLEALIASRRKQRPASDETNFCPNCGKSVIEGDRFCTNCGEEIN
jgi:hypothetical protein